ncbi:MAG: hypothetical protein OER21_07645, partial [Gemmatimonadota bacterium]|nr:hypothetical protein [Gemmatimonadota bacterium]
TAPALTLFDQTVGSGLQYSTSGTLGAPAPAGTVVRVTSADPAVVLVAPNASTPGTAFIDLALTPGATSYGYHIQGVEGATGSVTVTATAPGYTNGTATMTVVQPALDVIFLTTSTTSLSPNDPFQVRIGVPNAANQFMSIEQAIRAGGTPVTATVTNSDGTAAQLVTQAQTGNTVTTTIAVGQARSPSSLATGGVEFDPLNAGTTRVDATIAGFIALPSASVTVTITAPALTLFDQTVGSGLQYSTSGTLGAPAPAGTVVRVTSADPAVVLVAPNATTPGAAFIDITLSTGTSSFSYYIQGVEGATGSAVMTASAPGYTNGTATMTVVQPALDVIFLTTTTTSLSPNDPFQVRIGVPNAANQFMSIEQAIRAGGTAVTATVTTSNAGVGQLVTESLTGGTVTTTIAVGQARSPSSVTNGGIEFDPLTAGATTVSATIPNFIALPSASVAVTVSTPTLTLFSQTVGSGLQYNTSGTLGAPAPAGTVVRITSSNPSVALVAPDASTPGTPFIDLALATGVNSFGYYVQGAEGATGTVSLTATASGYTDGSTTATVAPPAVDIIFLNATTTVGAADDPFQLRIGVPNTTNQFMSIEQAIRAGGTAVTATVTSSDGAVAQLVTQSVTGTSVTVSIATGQTRSPSTVAAGGVAFDPLAVGTSTVAGSIPGFVSLPTASVSVTVNP